MFPAQFFVALATSGIGTLRAKKSLTY